MAGVTGLILAGGKARRMGGADKCFEMLAGKPLIAHVIERISPQVTELIINSGGDASRFDGFGLDVVGDVIDGQAGPLAGILTGMEWLAANRPQSHWLLTVPVDTPFLPDDLVAGLMQPILDGEADLTCAETNGRTHPVVGLWPVGLADDLRRAMTDEDMRKIDLWTARHGIGHVSFETDPIDPFFNINSPEDMTVAAEIAGAL
ncbi:MAG: molybdenum cofactor guanylyltransferase MobA [Alphaproteobacteria bacterium]